eukprot:TRINITY_DN111419_c0_g1_i1.p1 TRINITY_DN111419_c0_g1~~TRINITY_DN111419_c0_g1_i1.p1  ORF type:complete len:546 (+),score=105.60 TRINITY_DN111419_c0_g1_i1:42-1679(+)
MACLFCALAALLACRASKEEAVQQEDCSSSECLAERDDAALLDVRLLQTSVGLTHRAAVAGSRLSDSTGAGGETFVHLFEWSWDDVAQECEQWLGPKGFTAVQVSPPNEHNTGASWNKRYQPVSYKSLTSRSGNESQFAAMVERCKNAGVGVYADIVINQMAPNSGVGVGGSQFGSRTYADEFGPDDFHHLSDDTSRNCGVHDYQDKHNVQYCDLLGMPDLCTGCERVQEAVRAYIEKLQKIGVAGIRIDAAKHMNATELGSLLSKVDTKLWRFLEVLKEPNEAVQPNDYFGLGRITEIGYGHTLGAKFKSEGKLYNDLKTLGEPWGLLSSDKAIVFLDNHDTQRRDAVLTYKDGDLYTMANVYMLAFPYGYPKIMSSYDFRSPEEGPPTAPVHQEGGSVRCGKSQPWVCEHRWPAIANMVAWRRSAGSFPVSDFQVLDGEDYGKALSFCRGPTACVAFNRQAASTWPVTMTVPLPAGLYCNVAESDSADCPTIQVAEDGTTSFTVPRLGVVAFHVGRRLKGDATTTSSKPASDSSASDSSTSDS